MFDADLVSRTGIDAKDIEVCSWHHINGSGVCAVIGDPVDILIEYRLNLTRCYRHGVSQTAGFSEVGTQVTGAIYGSSGTCAVILNPGVQNTLPKSIPYRRFCEVTKQTARLLPREAGGRSFSRIQL